MNRCNAAADLLKLADKSDWLISEWENKILPDGRIPLGLVKGQALEYVKGQFNSIGADLRIISKAIEAQQTDTLSELRTQIKAVRKQVSQGRCSYVKAYCQILTLIDSAEARKK